LVSEGLAVNGAVKISPTIDPVKQKRNSLLDIPNIRYLLTHKEFIVHC
jgi:hypothetical protein